jgi:hypothetical protein
MLRSSCSAEREIGRLIPDRHWPADLKGVSQEVVRLNRG